MREEITLLTITGLKARILKLILGTPFLLVGGVLVLVGLGDGNSMGNLLVLGIGGIVGLAGVTSYASAVTSDRFAVTLGGSSNSSFE